MISGDFFYSSAIFIRFSRSTLDSIKYTCEKRGTSFHRQEIKRSKGEKEL